MDVDLAPVAAGVPRRSLARTVVRSPRFAPVRSACRRIGSPAGALLAFSINLFVWHVPAVYDLALRSAAVHAAEHIAYLTTGILLWAQVIDSPPLHAHVVVQRRALYVVAAMAAGWVLSLVLAFAPDPLYPVYAHLAHRPGGISALTDQQLAAGMMLVPGSLTMTVFILVQLYRWLGAPEDAPALDGRCRSDDMSCKDGVRRSGDVPSRMTLSVALVCACLAVGALIAGCGGSQSPAPPPSGAVQGGGLQGLILRPAEQAPALALRNYTGEPVRWRRCAARRCS